MTHQFPRYFRKGKQVEYKTVSFLVKSIDQDQGIVTGLASPTTNVDHQKDQVDPGAYAQTLVEGKQRMDDGRRFMMACLWMHDPEKPTGGVISGEETPEGLLVAMKYDISTNAAGIPLNPIATMVFSGFKVGYIDELSIGYLPVKYIYDKQGVRHLQVIDLLEISAVTMLFAANPEALVPASGVKSMLIKSASGKTTWPLAGRDVAWDNGEAHNAIVAKATKEDGSLDEGLMKSVHFWYDESAPDKITSYKLLFCDVIYDEIKAIPRGIFACAGGHGLPEADIPEGDVEGVKAKIATYYKRMAKEFNDDSIKPSWEDDSKRRSMQGQQRKDFNTLYQAAQAADCLEDWGDILNTFTQAMIELFCMGDQPQEDMAACLDQLGKAVMEWLDKGMQCGLAEYLNSRYGYSGNNAPYVPYSLRVGDDYGYMARRNRPRLKIGARISNATQETLEEHQQKMNKALDAMSEHMKMMQESVDGLGQLWGDDQGNQGGKEPDDSDEGNGKSLRRRESPHTLVPRQQRKSTAKDLTIDDLAAMLV